MSKSEIDKCIKNIEDFFDLPEAVQDKIVRYPDFEYEKIWDKLDSEHKMMLTMEEHFRYEKFWDKLGIVEKYNVIQYNENFDWQRFIPNPNTEELDMLVKYRKDFDYDFDKLIDSNHKQILTRRQNFDYEKYWDKLHLSLKANIIEYNKYFDPEKYWDDLQLYYDGHISIDGKDKLLLDIFCERKDGILYEKVWSKLSIFQKMKIAIKNHSFIVGDKKEELLQLFKKYPFQMLDFITYKIIPKPTIFNQGNIEICFKEMTNLKEIAIDIFKSFTVMNYDDIKDMRIEILKGNGRSEIKFTEELQRLYPFCVVRKDKDMYYYNISHDTYTKIVDYYYVLREGKLERLLNNPKEK